MWVWHEQGDHNILAQSKFQINVQNMSWKNYPNNLSNNSKIPTKGILSPSSYIIGLSLIQILILILVFIYNSKLSYKFNSNPKTSSKC